MKIQRVALYDKVRSWASHSATKIRYSEQFSLILLDVECILEEGVQIYSNKRICIYSSKELLWWMAVGERYETQADCKSYDE
jgi:hypothetical protein